MAKIKETNKKRPIGVSILAVLSYVGAVVSLFIALLAFIGSAFLNQIILKINPSLAGYSSLGSALAVIIGIFFLIAAILDFFIGKGLWEGRNWARILVLVLSSLSALGALFSFRIVSLIIDGLIIWYLGFYKPSVKYFS